MSIRAALCVVVLLLAGCNDKPADPAVARQSAKAGVQELNDALIKEDFGKVVDLTYPKLVEKMGGRDKMIATLKAGTAQMKSTGFTFNAVKVDEPGEIVSADHQQFLVVPFLLEMKSPAGRMQQKTSVIGISEDGGRSWKYLNGEFPREQIKQILPNLPDKLQLPAPQKPDFKGT
jgi:hypothetical protein